MKRTPLRPGEPPRRKTPLAPTNPSRLRALFKRQFHSEAFVQWVQAQRCAICDYKPPSECAHAVSRGAGGRASDVLPACGFCHWAQHNLGIETFEKAFDCDLKALAADCWKRWQATQET